MQMRSFPLCFSLLCLIAAPSLTRRVDASPDDSDDGQCCASATMPKPGGMPKPVNMAFIIGAQKGGTTFLFDELSTRHPAIRAQKVSAGPTAGMKILKEAHLFDDWDITPRGYDMYLKRFARTGHLNSSDLTFMDATPNYMPLSSAACRIAATFPAAKIIAVLRDPAQRAMSHWNMMKFRHGKFKEGVFKIGDYDEEVFRELKNMRDDGCSFESPDNASHTAPADGAAASWSRAPGIPSWNKCFKCLYRCGIYSPPAEGEGKGKCTGIYSKFALLRRGLYVYQLEMWLKHFRKEQLLVINQLEMLEEPEAVLNRVISFLGHDPKLKVPKKEAKGGSGWSIPLQKGAKKAYDEATQVVKQYFQYPNEELYRLMASLGPASGWRGTFESLK